MAAQVVLRLSPVAAVWCRPPSVLAGRVCSKHFLSGSSDVSSERATLPPLTGLACRRHFSSGGSDASSERALMLLEDLRHLRRAPLPALVLGAGGLLPFAAAPALMLGWGVYSAPLLAAQVAYGATILSFVGGVRWGAALPAGAPLRPDWCTLLQAVVPQLVAWTGLLVAPAAGALLVMAGLATAAYWDLLLAGYPAWFKALRFCLSVGAILAMWTCLMCSWLLPVQSTQAAQAEQTK